jgi:hypothetical protein
MLPLNKHNNILKTKFESASNSVFCFVLSYDHVNVCFILIWILVVTLVVVIRCAITTFIIRSGIVLICTDCCSTGSESFCLETILFDLSVIRSLISLLEVKTIIGIVPIGFLSFNYWGWLSFSYFTSQNWRLILQYWLFFLIEIQIWIIIIEDFTLRFWFCFLFFKIWVFKFIFLIRAIELSLLANCTLRWVLLLRLWLFILWLLESS